MGLVLMGGAMLSKSLIQFSVDGWCCVPSLLIYFHKEWVNWTELNRRERGRAQFLKEWHYQNFILEKSFWLAIWYSNLTPGHIFGQNYGLKEDEMAGWHHRLDGHEFEWTPGVGDGQGGLACCDSQGHKESDTTEWLNWTEPLSSLPPP